MAGDPVGLESQHFFFKELDAPFVQRHFVPILFRFNFLEGFEGKHSIFSLVPLNEVDAVELLACPVFARLSIESELNAPDAVVLRLLYKNKSERNYGGSTYESITIHVLPPQFEEVRHLSKLLEDPKAVWHRSYH